MIKKISYCLLLICTLLFAGSISASASTESLTILYASRAGDISSTEAQRHAAQLATAIAKEKFKNKNVLFLHGGNSLGPSLLGVFDQGAHLIDYLEQLGPDAMALGYNELIYGQHILSQRLEEADFPVLNSTLHERHNQKPIDGTLPFKVFEVGNKKVGVFAVLSKDTLVRYPVEEYEIHNPEKVAEETVAALKTEGVDLIVAMTGNNPEVLATLNSLPDIDLVLSSDPKDIQSSFVNNKLNIRQNGLTHLAAIDVGFEQDTGEATLSPRLMSVKTFTPLNSIIYWLSHHKEKLTGFLGKKIGVSQTPFETLRQSVRTGENAFANFIADTIRESINAEVAFVNGGDIRGDRTYDANFELTWEEIQKELPFNDTLVLLELTGKDILTALENSVSKVETNDGRFLHLSNANIVFSKDLPPNERVISVRIDGRPLDLERTYRVGTTEYLAKGGDNYTVFKQAQRIPHPKSNDLLWKTVSQRIMDMKAVSFVLEDRIKDVPAAEATFHMAQIDLTQDEQNWIADNPVIKIANEMDWPPFDYVKDQKPFGFSIDVVEKALQKAGLKAEFINGYTWKELVEKFNRKEIDLLPAVYFTPERTQSMLFTDGYAVNPPVLVFDQKKQELKTLKDLEGKKLAVPPDTSFDQLIKARYPKIERVPVDGALKGLEAVAIGQADAFIESLSVVTVLLEQNMFPNLRLEGVKDLQKEGESHLRMASAIDNPMLRDIVQKGLHALSRDERNKMLTKHFAANRLLFEIEQEKGGLISLNPQEKKWLKEHPKIRLVTDPYWPPLEFFDEKGQYSGLTAGYIEAVSKRLGIDVQYTKEETWFEGYKKALKGELDVVAGIIPSEEREENLLFTKPYLSIPFVIAINTASTYVEELSALKGKKVGVVEGYLTDDLLKKDYPEINRVRFKTAHLALEALHDGELDAVLESSAVISYEQNRLNLTDVKIVAPTEYKLDITMGVRKDWPELVPLLNRALDDIDVKERAAIKNTWMSLNIQFGLDIKTILMWATPIVLAAIAIITVVLLSNRKLKKAEAEIEAHRVQLHEILENVPQGVVLFGIDNRLVAWNSHYPSSIGADPDFLTTEVSMTELAKQVAPGGVFGPGDIDELVEDRAKQLWSGDYRGEVSFDGEHILDAQATITPTGRLVVIYTDITQRKQEEHKLQDAYDVISSSIEYASNIQRSLLPNDAYLREDLREHFIIWQPRDVVGGDLYWYRRVQEGFIVILADCTGHGVPGAFMTMLSTGALDRALRDRPDGDPASLISLMHKSVQRSLGQDKETGESDDGLELGICRIRLGKDFIYSGARFSLFQVQGDKHTEIKGDKKGIGYRSVPTDTAFTNHIVEGDDADTFYMVSDGVMDQVGGPRRLGFGKKRLLKLLKSLNDQPLETQKEQIIESLIDYQGEESRRDDVSMIGFKV